MTDIGPTDSTFTMMEAKNDARGIIVRLQTAHLLADALYLAIDAMDDARDSADAADLRGSIAVAMHKIDEARLEIEAVARWLPTG